MKTLIIYNDIENPLRYAIVDGDYSKFNNVCFNSMSPHSCSDECSNFLFDMKTGEFLIELSPDHSLLENKGWDKVAIITFLP